MTLRTEQRLSRTSLLFLLNARYGLGLIQPEQSSLEMFLPQNIDTEPRAGLGSHGLDWLRPRRRKIDVDFPIIIMDRS